MLTLLADSYESPVKTKQKKVKEPTHEFDQLNLSFFFVCLQELVKQILSAIKSVAGNDDVKDAVVSAGGVPLIVMVMNRHLSIASVR